MCFKNYSFTLPLNYLNCTLKITSSAISPPIQTPTTRGYASSMPVLDSENIEPNKVCFFAAFIRNIKTLELIVFSYIERVTRR